MQAFKAHERYQDTLRSRGLEYLQAAESMMADFLSNFKQSLPERLDF